MTIELLTEREKMHPGEEHIARWEDISWIVRKITEATNLPIHVSLKKSGIEYWCMVKVGDNGKEEEHLVASVRPDKKVYNRWISEQFAVRLIDFADKIVLVTGSFLTRNKTVKQCLEEKLTPELLDKLLPESDYSIKLPYLK